MIVIILTFLISKLLSQLYLIINFVFHNYDTLNNFSFLHTYVFLSILTHRNVY